jgi:hypothetical protein
MTVNYHYFGLQNLLFKGLTSDMSGVLTRQRKLHFVPEGADGHSLSINYIHTYILLFFTTIMHAYRICVHFNCIRET